jgi:hypothetical protein
MEVPQQVDMLSYWEYLWVSIKLQCTLGKIYLDLLFMLLSARSENSLELVRHFS